MEGGKKGGGGGEGKRREELNETTRGEEEEEEEREHRFNFHHDRSTINFQFSHRIRELAPRFNRLSFLS